MKYKSWFCLHFLFVCIGILTVSCCKAALAPVAKSGILDAAEFLKDDSHILKLVGGWQYYPWLMVSPADLPTLDTQPNKEYFTVPGVWSESFWNRGFLAGDGYASFRILIKHNLKNEALSLKIPEMETAYVLFVDGEKLANNGIVSSSELNSRPEYRPLVADFVPSSDQSEFILQISNYHHRKGGPSQIISLGKAKAIHAQFDKEILKDMLLVGSILFMGIYHLLLYFNRKKNRHTYWFALACLLICLRVFFTGNKYITLFFPNLPWELHLKLSYLSFFLIPPVFCRYVFLLFKPHFAKIGYKIIFNVGLLFSLLVLLTKSSFYTYLMIPYQIFTLLGAIYVTIVIFKVIRNKQVGSVLFLFSFLIFIMTFLNDIMVNNIIITTPLMAHYGIFMMFLFQSLFIARGFSKGFQDAENLANELIEKNRDLETTRSQLTNLNEKLEDKVNEKTKELQSKLDQIGKDLKLAKSIVNSLTTIPNLSPYLNVQILYQPLSEVGGDIFSVKKIQDTYFRFFLVDATGHGLQAALYTMMIQSEFERLNEIALKPNDLLFYLNQHFYDKNADLQIYFPAVVLDFDFSQSILRFACAGMQNHLLQKKNGDVIFLENTGPIIGILENYRFGMVEHRVEKGDRIFIYTDGIFEELNEIDGIAALREFTDVLKNTIHLPIEEVISNLTENLFDKMKKSKWKDDVSIIALEVGLKSKSLLV
ncbi:SpoIIE family protein phosphatase [Leptospira ilyithenensis]|uniref:Serine/threonine protein phosphatase n=1 Tax=Leptospira ilyithenensis TaxID=2484901 RepID=A0A4R9LLV9_9LEPT|nr:SpoIIE family protein phosphatase [Leptospira ilyithenensis]TGN06968.1 serine/threonine protein phosphatase [Leptospira ilyithenensis]